MEVVCSGSYAMIPLQVRGLLYLGFEQVGNKKCLEILPPVLTSLLQSQALNQEIPSLQLHSRERAVAGCSFMHCRHSGDCTCGVLGYQAHLLAHLNPDLSGLPQQP